jgi:hypothetical protein
MASSRYFEAPLPVKKVLSYFPSFFFVEKVMGHILCITKPQKVEHDISGLGCIHGLFLTHLHAARRELRWMSALDHQKTAKL